MAFLLLLNNDNGMSYLLFITDSI